MSNAEESDELHDSEMPEEFDADHDEDGSVDTEPCPYCGKPVYEQAQVCPHCRSYISAEDAPPGRGKSKWIVIAALAAIAAIVVGWVLRWYR